MSARNRMALTIICFLLGVGLVAQMRGRRGQSLPTVASQDLSSILGGLVVANADLRDEVLKLERELQAYNRAADRAVLPQMMEELAHMRVVNGHVQVAGPGVEVYITGLVSAVELQDLLNEVRNAGAEAISLNGIRIVASSALTEDERSVILDGQRLVPPYVFQAIGDPATMETALNRPGGQLSFLRLSYPGLETEVKTVQQMVLPAREGRAFELAQPVEAKEQPH